MGYNGVMIATFIAMMAIGVVIGVFSGLLGIGGGTVMVPVFRLVFGMSPIASTATSLFTIIPTSVSGTITHIRRKSCVPKLGLVMGAGGACTSPIGAWLANNSPGWLIMLAAAIVIAYSAITMFEKALKAPRTGHAAQASAVESPQAAASSEGSDALPSLAGGDLAKGALIGLVAGLASGYVGLGGGFLMVPLMMSLLGMPMRLTSGTSLIAVMILATPGTVLQCALGNVDYWAGVAMACGSIPGAFIGARLVKRVPERQLRFAFAGFFVIAAILLVVNELGMLS